MSPINPILLYGLGLVLAPVILHFLMRAKPRKLLFPALRLIQVRHKTNVRRMRLRHVWLLLLRVLVIALIVLALSRPRLPAANYALTRGELFTLLTIAAVVGGIYLAVTRRWRKAPVSQSDFAYRRTLLRGGLGAAAVLAILLLVAWPYQKRVSAELTSPSPTAVENLPVAAVCLFDTSLSMEYRHESLTRLDVARQIAESHLEKFPSGSKIAVADTSSDDPVLFQVDLIGVKSRIDSLEARPVSHPLNDRLRAALTAQEEDRLRTLEELGSSADDAEEQNDQFVREIYLFTDLAKSGWRLGAAAALRAELERLPWVQLYLIDVGVESPRNTAIAELKLSRETVPAGGDLYVTAVVESTGEGQGSRPVQLDLYVENESGSLVKQETQTVTVGGDEAQQVTFHLSDLPRGVRRGEVRLNGADAIVSDDVRYFAAQVRPPPEVLVIGHDSSETLYLIEALAPAEQVRQGKARYRCTFLPIEGAAGTDFSRFDVVCLVNVAAPAAELWNRLAEYVDRGGGLAVFLGNRRIQPVAWNTAAAQSILPGELLARLPFAPPERIDFGRLSHPVFQKFQEFGGAGDLSSVDVNYYWRVAPHDSGAVIATYTDWRKDPAVLVRAHGEGRVLMMTTAIDRKGWADLPAAGWQFFVLAEQITQYLSGEAEQILNFTTAQTPVVRLDRKLAEPTEFLLREPSLQQLPRTVPAGTDVVAIDSVDQVGHYEFLAADAALDLHAGFAVNAVPEETRLTRLDAEELTRLFGEERFQLVRDIDELTRRVYEGRIGQEIASILLGVMVIAFCAEHFVANRFYEADQQVGWQHSA